LLNNTQLVAAATSLKSSVPAGRIVLLAVMALVPFRATLAQDAKKGVAKPASPPPPVLTRRTTRHEVRRFGYGGTLTIYGAPEGSVTVEAWPRNEIDITADIEWRADTEEELAQLAALTSAASPRWAASTSATRAK